MPKAKTPSKPGRQRVSAKIKHMMKEEGMPQKQAVAAALHMEEKGRLGPKGGYRRVKSKKAK